MAFPHNAPLLVGSAIAFSILLPTAAKAENLDHVRQLLRTNACENCDLSGANLSALDLTDAVLTGSDLSNANLNQTTLVRADLEHAVLRNAFLSSSDLRGANLRHADLTSVQGFNLCDVDFGASAEEECQFFHLMMTLGSELCRDEYGLADSLPTEMMMQEFCSESDVPQLNGMVASGFFRSFAWFPSTSSFMAADLTHATFSHARLVGIDFRYATLTDTDFSGADLTYAFLMETEWDRAINADLSRAYQTREDVAEVVVAIAQEQARSREQQMQLARQSEATTYLGAMNRAQQAYFLEEGTFASDLDSLQLGISETTRSYELAIAYSTDTYAIQTATSQESDLPSYVGMVYLSLEALRGSDSDAKPELITRATLCVTDVPSTERPEVDALADTLETRNQDEPVSCPDGFHEHQ
ncbi:MAG: type IV pilin-like G/H family protein [Cyanobacteria bacterium J06627_8]